MPRRLPTNCYHSNNGDGYRRHSHDILDGFFIAALLFPERFKAHLSLVNRNCMITLTYSTETSYPRYAEVAYSGI